jgi:hypothetical protein
MHGVESNNRLSFLQHDRGKGALSMSKRSTASLSCFCAALVASVPLCLGGCGSQPAGANAGTSVATSSADAPGTSAPASNPAPKPKLPPGAKTVALARAGDRPYDKTFDDLRFEMTVGDKFERAMLTKEIEAMSGQKIRIRGYILPTAQNHGIKEFVLVRDNQECCFGPGAALYDCILVAMKPGQTANFTIRPITVEGTFNIREFVLDGKHLAIYQMDAESAR